MFFVTGIIIILGMGAFSMNIISQSSTLANTVDGSSFQEIQAMQEVQMKQIKILILSAILVFSYFVYPREQKKNNEQIQQLSFNSILLFRIFASVMMYTVPILFYIYIRRKYNL